jgi:hypothetical protein
VNRSPFKSQSTAITTAFLISPLIAVAVGAAFTPAGSWLDPVTDLVFALIAYLITLAVGILFGVPIFLLLAKARLINWWMSIFAGFAVGFVMAVLIRLQSTLQLHDVVVLGSEGAASALSFWVIWKTGPEPFESEARNWADGFLRSK